MIVMNRILKASTRALDGGLADERREQVRKEQAQAEVSGEINTPDPRRRSLITDEMVLYWLRANRSPWSC